MNIVVVEDHAILRDVTVTALREMGHLVEGVDSAEALTAVLPSFAAQIVLLDLNLPGEDGISLAQRLRRSNPALGIIMVTARTELSDKLAGYSSGADLYLPKPTSVAELGAAIEALSRRLVAWAEHTAQTEVDPRALNAVERARSVRQQLVNTVGKLPTLKELASLYGVSTSRLNEEFSACYGLKIVPYITQYRLKEAHDAIVNTSIPLKILASRLGYSHLNHFISAFRKHFGYPPGALRRKGHGSVEDPNMTKP